MKRYLFALIVACCCSISTLAQGIIEGTCGKDLRWTFDGKTLVISNISKNVYRIPMEDYNTQKHKAPWIKMGLDVRNVRISEGVSSIGSCAFANMSKLSEVVFEDFSVNSIEWGAFYNCERLTSISLPNSIRKIGTIAFANCRSITSVKIPDQCLVQDQAFINCSGLRSIEVSPTANLGSYVFASEVKIDGSVHHSLYDYEIRRLPSLINTGNCHTYGLSKNALTRYREGTNQALVVDYDYLTSEVDSIIPQSYGMRHNMYALVIGNQNYRFVSEVPFAIHDARVFAQYCERTLGIPATNIHICEDATKQLILEDELGWLENIPNREGKRLIVYYAGHGVPDVQNKNKAYILPTDVRGTKPQYGISLDDFYSRIGQLAFSQTSVFLDACFSGVNRDNESVNEGLRGVEIAAEEGVISEGNMVVFSAAQGNETAQCLPEEGHGLFTYYLLKGLQMTGGEVYFGDLASFLAREVSSRAETLKMRKPQTPSTTASSNMADTWRTMNF